ncbi:MAG: DUF2891 family protein, partial [Casimicrobiaceae bacterium]
NSAFGLLLALDYAQQAGGRPAAPNVPGTTPAQDGGGDGATVLARACAQAARTWYATDRCAPVRYEPSGADFLSPSLIEAALMQRVLEPAAFEAWLAAFLPGIDRGEPRNLVLPVSVADRGDPQTVHLDGLNLSRAWCFAAIGRGLAPGQRLATVLRVASDAHLAAGWGGLASGDYAGEHWLATFALLALEARDAPEPSSNAFVAGAQAFSPPPVT